MDSRGIRRAVCITSLLASTIATAGQERDLRKRLTPETNSQTEVRVVRVTPFRFGGPEAGETAKILRRALSESVTKAAPFRDW